MALWKNINRADLVNIIKWHNTLMYIVSLIFLLSHRDTLHPVSIVCEEMAEGLARKRTMSALYDIVGWLNLDMQSVCARSGPNADRGRSCEASLIRDGAARGEPRVRHCGGDDGAPAAA